MDSNLVGADVDELNENTIETVADNAIDATFDVRHTEYYLDENCIAYTFDENDIIECDCNEDVNDNGLGCMNESSL